MLDERFVILGFLLNLIGSLSYVIDTIRGKVKPNRVSWFLWALAPLIAFSAQVKQGVGLQSLMTFAVGFGPLCVFVASFFSKKSERKLSSFDLFCGGLSILGLVLWYITKVGNLAILFSIFADGIAAVPTIIKSWKAPETESYMVFLLSAISATITLLTIEIWNFAHYAFPVYILSVCLLLTILIRFQIGKAISLKLSKTL